MLNLFLENCRYIARSRMVYLILIFSFLVHYSGMKFIDQLTISIKGVVSILGPAEALYTALFLQIFTALCISSVYGIWMAPYAHRGDRSVLTHMLPVSRFNFPLCYMLCCALLLIINFVVMMATHFFVYGGLLLSNQSISLWALIKGFGYEILCLEVIMLALSVSSMYFGQVATVFVAGSFLFVLQIIGTFARFFKEQLEPSVVNGKRIFLWAYQSLPPVGDFIFDLKGIVTQGELPWRHLLLWIVWLVAFVFMFRFKIRFPLKSRSTES